MKLILKNADLVFEKVTLVRKQVSYTVTQENVGSKILVAVNLDDIPVRGTVLTVKQSGDTVVADNNYTLYVNNDWGTPFNTQATFTVTAPAIEVALERGSTISAGTVTLTVEYYKSNNAPSTVQGRLTLENNVGELNIQLPEAKESPVGFTFVPTRIGGMADTGVVAHLYNTSDTEISATNITINSVKQALVNTGGVSVKSIKINRPSGSARSIVVDYMIYYY